jgi:hypothetical protein
MQEIKRMACRWWIALHCVLVTMASHAVEPRMDEAQAEVFVKMALAGIDREYPNKPGAVLTRAEDLRTPREMHPVFYGHFDWHSSVHGHWMLVRCLRLQPKAPWAAEVRKVLDTRFTEKALKDEAVYFTQKENRSFERMYGWAWLLRLGQELRSWEDADAKKWLAHLEPLESMIVSLAKEYLPKLDWPVRCGFHPESAFPLGQFFDWAKGAGDAEFEKLIRAKAIQFYGKDRDYPVSYEPSGNDFFSPGLNAADLMRRVLDEEKFSQWLSGYFPQLAQGKAGNLLDPVSISDPTDGQLIHLAGLNLTRAWTMKSIARSLNDSDPRRAVLEKSSESHGKAGLAMVSTGHYEGEHWLASFAVYMLSDVGIAD